MEKICIIGADGFIGYSLYTRLVKKYKMLAIDNLWKRNIVTSYLDIQDPVTRFGKNFILLDVLNFSSLKNTLDEFNPDVIIHLGQQRSAPYSMGTYNDRKFTIENNTIGTLNVLEYIKNKKNIHLIHIGSMGVYGYNNLHILEEGDNANDPGSLYHITKCFDQIYFKFYNKNYNCQITDLHQGIVWGVENGNRLDYDGDHGTVVNRFLIQSINNLPLTLYGDGTQKRAFIHLSDCVECICNFLQPNGYRIINQFTEIYRLQDIANMIDINQTYIPNPRIEKLNNTLEAKNITVKSVLKNPIKLTDINLMQDKLKLPKNRNIDMECKKLWTS